MGGCQMELRTISAMMSLAAQRKQDQEMPNLLEQLKAWALQGTLEKLLNTVRKQKNASDMVIDNEILPSIQIGMYCT